MTTNDHLIKLALQLPSWFSLRVVPKIRVESNGCWVWTASCTENGYGRIHIPRAVSSQHPHVQATRVVWMFLVGDIPSDYVLDHDGSHGCHNKSCVNPAHLQAVTQYHNVVVTGNGFSATHAQTTHCPKGHSLIPGNLVVSQTSKGSRQCLKCAHDYGRERSKLLSLAAQTLGIGRREYVATYGWSRSIAKAFLGEESTDD